MRLAVTAPGQPEIFHSLQGEGVSAGKPSIFVRLSQCNLHCVWCDTPYTWNFNGTEFEHRETAKYDRAAETVDMSVDDLVAAIAAYPARRVIFTGGEPLLQQRELGEVCAALKAQDDDWFLEIETNGTITPQGKAAQHLDQFNVSPKLAHSGNDNAIRIKPETLAFFANDPRATFKFVVQSPDDVAEIETLITLSGMPRARIFLMPEGTTPDALANKQVWLAPLCLEMGVNYTGRLHIDLYGDTRGT